MARNERTSARVAKIAGKVLALKVKPLRNSFAQVAYARNGIWEIADPNVTWSDIRALAASALTQAPDKVAIVSHVLSGRATIRIRKNAQPKRPLSRKRILKQVRKTDRARAAYRESVEATATSPADRPRKGRR